MSTRFEERLLGELKQVIGEREPAPVRVRRPLRWHWRLAAAGLGVVAAVAWGVTQQGAPAAAYNVTVEGDLVRVEISRLADAEGLERKLAEVGIPAEVTYLPPGKVCRPGRYAVAHTNVIGGFEMTGDSLALVLRPAEFRDGSTLVIETAQPGQGVSSVGFATATGPVPPCEAIDVPARQE